MLFSEKLQRFFGFSDLFNDIRAKLGIVMRLPSMQRRFYSAPLGFLVMHVLFRGA